MFKPDTLLFFSGGLDSTGAFWQLLKDNKKVHVHHMNLKNVEKRSRAESIAVQKIIKYMKNMGEFVYSESSHEYPVYNNQFIYDSDICSFIAGTICLASPWIKYVALGLTASDINRINMLKKRIQRANTIFGAFDTGAKKIYPVKDLTKLQIYNMLPAELKDLTWTCRTPIYNNNVPQVCNHCESCKEMGKINANHSS